MHLFKYLRKEHLDAFFDRGTLRLGTLFEYRDTARYGIVTGDALEGTHITELSIPGGGEIDLDSDTPEAQFFRSIVPATPQNSGVTVVLADGARIMSHTSSPNLYVYCMTSEYDASVMGQFGCDSCMKVFNFPFFFSAVTRELRKTCSILQWGIGPVHYANKQTNYLSPHTTHPAIMKDTEYAYQKEWRAFWRLQDPPSDPLILNVPRARFFAHAYEP